jgi:hypothetical protein
VLFAVAAVAMILVAYVIAILLAVACAYLPCLLTSNLEHEKCDSLHFCGWSGDRGSDALVTGAEAHKIPSARTASQ